LSFRFALFIVEMAKSAKENGIFHLNPLFARISASIPVPISLLSLLNEGQNEENLIGLLINDARME